MSNFTEFQLYCLTSMVLQTLLSVGLYLWLGQVGGVVPIVFAFGFFLAFSWSIIKEQK